MIAGRRTEKQNQTKPDRSEEMNKELIERIVAEISGYLGRPTDGSYLNVFAEKLIDRIAAERWKDAAYFVIEDEDGDVEFNKTNQFSGGRTGGKPLFLSPTIPEGMALMPIEPTDEIFRAMQCSGWMPSNYAAMLAAGQRQIAAGGVQP